MRTFCILLLAANMLACSSCRSLSNPASEGREAARADLRAGKLALETTAFRPWSPVYARLLRERYHIDFKNVSERITSPEVSGYRHGYNEIMRNEILRRYGSNVLERTAEEAQGFAAHSPQ